MPPGDDDSGMGCLDGDGDGCCLEGEDGRAVTASLSFLLLDSEASLAAALFSSTAAVPSRGSAATGLDGSSSAEESFLFLLLPAIVSRF